MAAGKNLTDEDWRQILERVAEGDPVPAVAESFGITRQAFYMRRGRDPEFDRAAMQAEAMAFLKTWRELGDAIRAGSKVWQAIAWKLERVHKVLNPVDEAKIKAIGANYASEQERQKKLRAFIEKARAEAEGDPEAKASDDDGFADRKLPDGTR